MQFLAVVGKEIGMLSDILMLMDFYGQLLTARTRGFLELHYEEDMSFSEIAELEGVSRQAVHDSVKRGVLTLRAFEKKMGLIHRFQQQGEIIRSALMALQEEKTQEAGDILTRLMDQL